MVSLLIYFILLVWSGKVQLKVGGVKPEKKTSATEALPTKKPALKPAEPKKVEPESDDSDEDGEV